jgi:hypothetical protein
MRMILFYVKLLTQLTINRFNHLPNFVNPPLGFFGYLLLLVAAGQRYQIDTVGLG